MATYKVLNRQVFPSGSYSIVPIRKEDKYAIMNWRNEQLYHLRQHKPLTEADQDAYFGNVVAKLFDQEFPSQILFSYLENGKCIGYGGLVHINWIDKNVEISFIMDTALEKEYFEYHWGIYLKLIEEVAFQELNLHKIFTYAFDFRPRLYPALESAGFTKEARLKEHCLFEGKYLDVLIHSKIQDHLVLRAAQKEDIQLTYEWANHPETRAYSFSKDFINFESHTAWFTSKITDSNCKYLLLENNGFPLGSIRVDIKEEEGTISYLIAPGLKGKGYGKKIVQKLLGYLKKEKIALKKVVGWVQEDNISSIKIFEKTGFEKVQQEDGTLKFEIEF
jgi:RimJ/RimL family protein N-acetyltransferase